MEIASYILVDSPAFYDDIICTLLQFCDQYLVMAFLSTPGGLWRRTLLTVFVSVHANFALTQPEKHLTQRGYGEPVYHSIEHVF